MHYYKRHIGDYAKKAGHLSPLEHGVYNLIMDSYYDREQAPTLLEAMRWARARTEDEKSAVLAVLDEFFTFDGERYHQNRIEEELDLYRGKAETNRAIAVERERRKRERRANEPCTNRAPEQHESCTTGQPNHKPLTINQEEVRGEESATLTSSSSSPTRIGEICVLLRRGGINTSPDAVGKVDWSADPKVTDDLIRSAVDTAKKRAPRQITPAYLTPIIADLLAQADAIESSKLVAGRDYI